MAFRTNMIALPTVRHIVAIVVIVGLSSAISPLTGECMVSQKQITTSEGNMLPIARPVFLAARGAYNTLLADLAAYQETVEWQECYTVVRPVDPNVRIDFFTTGERFRIILPGASEFWPFVFSWLSDRTIDYECCALQQPALDDLQPANLYGLHVPYGCDAPFLRYELTDDIAAYVLFTEADVLEGEEYLLKWGMAYSIEIADAHFPDEAGWDLTMECEDVLASWSIPAKHGEDEREAGQALKAAWLVFKGRDIDGRLLPELSRIKSLHSRAATNFRLVEHEDSGAEEHYMPLPQSESGIYRILFIPAINEDQRRAAEMQEVLTDLSSWSAVHVGVFAMGEDGWLLLIFEGADE